MHSYAGWIITGRYIDSDGKTTLKRYFIQDNEVKAEKFNLIYSCNLKTGVLVIVDPVDLVYVKTTYNAYAGKLKEIKLKRLNELLALIPEDQKQDYARVYREQIENSVFLSKPEIDSVRIVRLNDSTKLLGYRTTKYIITDHGRKKEEFYFTEEVDVSPDFNQEAFLKFVFLLEPEDKTLMYMNSDNYLNTVRNGLVMRRFIFEDGFRSEWQVNKIEKQNIPAYHFGAPDLCKELTLDKWLVRVKESENKPYDDYE